MKIKAGATLTNPHPGVLLAMDVIDTYWRRAFKMHATITAGRDGAHSEKSYHYGVEGDTRERALDVRTRDLTPSQRMQAHAAISRLLGTAFDVVLEATHLHVEVEARKWGPLP